MQTAVTEKSIAFCGAKTRTGSPCKRRPSLNRSRCKLHGGASLSGPAHWAWKDGSQTRENRKLQSEAAARLRDIEDVAYMAGMIKGKRTRGRKPKRELK